MSFFGFIIVYKCTSNTVTLKMGRGAKILKTKYSFFGQADTILSFQCTLF